MTQEVDLKINFSGGAGNTLKENSTGGAIGGEVYSQSNALVNATDMITGVTIINSFGISGTVDLDYSLDTLTITQGVDNDSLLLTQDTFFTLFLDTDKYISFFVDFGTAGTVVNHSEVDFNDVDNLIFSDVTPSDSKDGRDQFKVIYITNQNTISDINSVEFYISQNSPGQDTLKIFVGAKNVVATDTGNPYTSNPDATYVQAEVGNKIAVGTLQPDDFVALYIKREVPANVDTYVENDTSLISIVSA